jgi:6-phosphogluconolactonase
MARQTLLDHVPTPPAQVYPVPTYHPSAQEAAAVYDRQVSALMQAHDGQIDISLLGMGPDGHTASLFPGYAALDAPAEQLAVAVEGSPKPPPTRISLTPAALNRAATTLFLVAGADKAAKVRAALRGPYDPHATPAQVVRPPGGHVIWMLDTAAAAEL